MTKDDAMRAELSARIAFREGVIAKWSGAADKPANVQQMALSHSGFSWFEIAVYRFQLGDLPGSRDAFARGADLMHASLAFEEPPTLATYVSALESAVLSGDRALAERMAASPVGPEPRPSLAGDRLAWGLALPALVTGDDGRARTHAGEAAAVREDKARYPGLGDAIGALVSGDTPGLTAALERVLAQHARYARNKRSWCYNSGSGLVCVPAAVLGRIAGWRGVAPGDPGGRRANVPLLLTDTAPGTVVEIEVDLLPDV